MHHWNQANFDGLASIGATCAAEADLAFFGQYCLLREKGLRKPANEAAASFVAHLEGLGLASQREIAVRLVQLQRANPHVHQLLSHPVRMALMNILRAWCDDSPKEVLPRISLGLLSRDVGHFEAALQLEPNEQTALLGLAEFHLSKVDFQTHHLSESRLIGSTDEADESLRQAEAFIARLESTPHCAQLKSELAHYKLLVSEWATYCANVPDEPFTQWSRSRGNAFNFPSIVYYTA
jgi:hypothetical protein